MHILFFTSSDIGEKSPVFFIIKISCFGNKGSSFVLQVFLHKGKKALLQNNVADFSPEIGDLYFINTEVSSLKAQNSKNSYFEIRKNKGGNGFS